MGKDARFQNKAELFGLVRERYLLFVKCLESAPGKEPAHPYLYPQAPVAAAHHGGGRRRRRRRRRRLGRFGANGSMKR